MPAASITLEIVRGSMEGAEFIYTQPARCVIGRAEDCDLRVPVSPENIDVSRHHCCLEISPPFVRVRDLRSLNGTYVNNQLIGCRGSAASVSEDTNVPSLPYQMLYDGDEIRIGDMVFRVTVYDPEEAALVEAEQMEMV